MSDTKVQAIDVESPAAETEVFEYPRLLDDEKVIYEQVVEIKQRCCGSFCVTPKCCATMTIKMRITVTNMRLLVGEFTRNDRCGCVCCSCPAPKYAHETNILVEEHFWKDVRSVSKHTKRFDWKAWCFWCCCCCTIKDKPQGDKADVKIVIKHQARPYRLLMPKDIAEELMTAVISAKQEAKVLG